MRHKIRSPMKNMAYAERVSLGEMEKRLPPQFVRCHKSYIINIVYVDSIVGSLIYMAIARDSAIIFAFRHHMSPIDTNELLYELQFDLLS